MGLFKRNDSTEIVQKEMQISYISHENATSRFNSNHKGAKCSNHTNSTALILWTEAPQAYKPTHEIYTLHFLFDKYDKHIAIPRSPFFFFQWPYAKFLTVPESRSLLWLVYVTSGSFQQTLEGKERVT